MVRRPGVKNSYMNQDLFLGHAKWAAPENEPFRFRTFLHASYDIVFSIRALPMMISKTDEVLEVGGERILGMPVFAAAAGAYSYMFKATRRSVESVQKLFWGPRRSR